jgi:WD40 repeat protein
VNRRGLLVLTCTMLLAGCGHDDAAKRESRSAAALSSLAQGRVPEDAAYYAWAASRLAPGPSTATGMLGVAIAEGGVVRVIDPRAGRTTAATRTERAVITAGADRHLRVWRASDGVLLADLQTPSVLTDMAAGNSSLIGAAGADESLWAYDTSDPGRPVATMVAPGGRRPGRELALAFGEQDRTLSVAYSDGTSETWDVDTRRRLSRDTRARAAVTKGPDGTAAIFTAATWNSDGGESPFLTIAAGDRIVQVGPGSGKARVRLRAPAGFGPITSLAADPYGDPKIAAGGVDGVLTDADTASGVLIANNHGRPITGVSLQGGVWYSSSAGVANQSTAQSQRAHGGPTARLISSPTGLLAVAPTGPVSILGDPGSGLRRATDEITTAASPGPDGTLLTTDGPDAFHILRLRSLRYSQAAPVTDGSSAEAQLVKTYAPSSSWWGEGDGNDLFVGDVTADEQYVLSGVRDPTGTSAVLVWDRRTGHPVRRLVSGQISNVSGGLGAITDVRHLPDHDLIVGYDGLRGEIISWSTRTWNVVHTTKVGPIGGTSLAADGHTLAIAGLSDEQARANLGQRIARLWFLNLTSGNITHERSAPGLQDVAYAPDGKTLATFEDGGVVQLRAADGSPTGRRFHVETDDDSVLIWNPRGEQLALLDSTGSLKFLDVVSGRLAGPLPHDDQTRTIGLGFSEHGDRFYTLDGREDDQGHLHPGTASIWSLDTPALQQRMCRLIGRPVSKAQWKSRIGAAHAQMACRTAHAHQLGPPLSGPLEPAFAFSSLTGAYLTAADGTAARIGPGAPDSYTRVTFAWRPGHVSYQTSDTLRDVDYRHGTLRQVVCVCRGVVPDGSQLLSATADNRALLAFTTPLSSRPSLTSLHPRPAGEVTVLAAVHGVTLLADTTGGEGAPRLSAIYAADAGGRLRRITAHVGGAVDQAGAVDARGRRIALTVTSFSGGCGATQSLMLLERRSRTWSIRRIAPPGHYANQSIFSLRWTADGRLSAAIGPTCVGDDATQSPPEPTVYDLSDDDAWTPTGRTAVAVTPTGIVARAHPGLRRAHNTLTVSDPGGTHRVAGGVFDIAARP